MRTTLIAACGGLLLASAASSVPATAKPQIACHLVHDAAHDTHVGVPQAGVPTDEPELDILGADVAVDNRWVTAAVDVRSLAGLSSTIPGSWRWSVRFTVGVTTYMLHARLGQGGAFGDVMRLNMFDDSTDSWTETGVATAKVRFDQQRRQVRITVARRLLDGNGGVPIGETLTALHAYTWHERTAYTEYFAQPGGEYDMADTASSGASYVAGASSCVKPGS